MILLDTNLVSEPLRQVPEARVVAWMDSQDVATLYLSAVAVAELRSGLALLPSGKRRNRLRDNLEKRVLPLFSGRILPFDMNCTSAYAELIAKASAAGRVIATADGFIAAIAIANGLSVATRNTSPFEAAGVQKIINPWAQ